MSRYYFLLIHIFALIILYSTLPFIGRGNKILLSSIGTANAYISSDIAISVVAEFVTTPQVPTSIDLSKAGLPTAGSLLRLLCDGEGPPYDVMIRSVDGSKASDPSLDLGAHRWVLSARSPVFKTMLSIPMAEAKSGVVEITDVAHDVMREVLRFIYLNKFTREMDTVLDAMGEDLLYAADKYEVAGLVGLCEQHFIRRVSDKNVLHLHQLALTYN